MPRFRPRSTLLTAFLLLTITGLSIVVVLLWSEVGPLRQEIRRYRNEIGELTIDDDTKMHAIYHATYQERTWRWRVFFPENARYIIYFSANTVPQVGMPERSHQQGYGFGPARDPTLKGEYELALALRSDETGEYYAALVFKVVDTGAKDPGWSGFSLKRPLKRNGASWPDGEDGAYTTEGDELETRQESDGRLLLLRHCVYRNNANAFTRPDPTEGLIVWIEMAPPATKD